MKKRIWSTNFLLLTLWWLVACERSSRNAVDASDRPQRVMSPAIEHLCNQLYAKNIRDKRISWKGNAPILFSFDASFPEEYIAAVKSAIETWNKAAGFELFRSDPNFRDYSVPANDGRNTFYFRKRGARGKAPKNRRALISRGWGLAVTVVNGRANEIIDADIIFDGIANNFSTSRNRVGYFDVESVALHELGHSLGLVHNEESSSIMFYGESSVNFSLRTLDATTIQTLDCEYR
ncbi:MAG: matrixin family metalloprotease [Bdellovibrionales bacterium]|nr:matrixin family metalloprotease [Bdellovibrionales bacterium]